MKRTRLFAFLLSAYLAGSLTASGAEIKILSAVPLAPGVEKIAAQYKIETGQVVQVQSVTTGDINRILSSNEPFDILIHRFG